MRLATQGTKNRKTTPEDRLAIRELYRAGEPGKEIAAAFGISPAAVSYHCKDIDRPTAVTPCGTPAAYRRHQHAGQDACRPCKDAWNEYCKTFTTGKDSA